MLRTTAAGVAGYKCHELPSPVWPATNATDYRGRCGRLQMPRIAVAGMAALTAGGRHHRFGMMSSDSRLTRSIILHGALFFLAQTAVLLAVTVGYRMGWQRFGLFLAISAAYHAGLTGLLVARRRDFHVEGADVPLTRVNLSNTLTFGRLSSIPTITYLIVKASAFSILPVILPFICVVFATDFLDGMVARRRKEITFVGRYLDSSSDYLMIIAVSIVLFSYGLIPLWFFILIMGRLILFALGMIWLTLREGKANPLATFLGKMSIFALMVLYALEVARLFEVPWFGNERVVTIIEYIVALIVAISVVDKAIFLARGFAAAPRKKRAPRDGASA